MIKLDVVANRTIYVDAKEVKMIRTFHHDAQPDQCIAKIFGKDYTIKESADDLHKRVMEARKPKKKKESKESKE